MIIDDGSGNTDWKLYLVQVSAAAAILTVSSTWQYRQHGACQVIKAFLMPSWISPPKQEYCNASLQDALRNRLLHKAESRAPDMVRHLNSREGPVRGD